MQCSGTSDALITNSIIWANSGYSLEGIGPENISFSKIKMVVGGIPDLDPNNTWPGEGNLNLEPFFADFDDDDYHLKTQYPNGRFNPTTGIYDSNDPVTSPLIDAGNIFDDYSLEPDPNGARINMGAYGNTDQASKSGEGVECFIPGDIYRDGIVNFLDFAVLANNWPPAAIIDPEADINNDGSADGIDLGIIVKFWLFSCQ